MDKTGQVKKEYRRQQWVELIRRRQESGMTVAGFCEANGLKTNMYYYWHSKLREEVCGQAVVELPLERGAESMSKTGTVKLRTGDLEVEIGNEASAATIEALVRGLRSKC